MRPERHETQEPCYFFFCIFSAFGRSHQHVRLRSSERCRHQKAGIRTMIGKHVVCVWVGGWAPIYVRLEGFQVVVARSTKPVPPHTLNVLVSSFTKPNEPSSQMTRAVNTRKKPIRERTQAKRINERQYRVHILIIISYNNNLF